MGSNANWFQGILLLFALLNEYANCDSSGNSSSCNTVNVLGYASQDSCTFQDMMSTPLRVVYLDKQYVTQNQAAIARAKALGKTYTFGKFCESISTAVPEW